jgi:hypothetical protein
MSEQKINNAVFDLACIGKTHLDQARQLHKQTPVPACELFFPVVRQTLLTVFGCVFAWNIFFGIEYVDNLASLQLTAEDYYRRLEAANFDPFQPDILKPFSPLPFQLNMCKHKLFSTF